MRLLLSLAFACQLSVSFADFATGGWPAPSDLSTNASLVAKAFSNITATLQKYIDEDGAANATAPALVSGISNLTFSLGIFSVHDTAASDTLQYHHTAPEIANAGNGTNSVDADSIYRIASVTKVLTALAGLIKLSPSEWDRPLAQVFRVLATFEAAHPGGSFSVDWSAVTLRSLAAQIGGVPRDGFPSGNELLLLQTLGQADPASMGLPPANASDPLQNPPCATLLANGTLCPAVPYLESTANRPPAFEPWAAPGYANNGFALLGMALANLTDRPFADLVQETVFGPLGMHSSSINSPPASAWNRSVIAYPQAPTEFFDIEAGVLSGSGAALSTQRDLARLGVGILRSDLLAPSETRRWLKPVSFTGRLQYAVGAPWEIHRYTLPNNKVVDLYTKSGDSGAYSAFLVLIPDYGLGFTLLSASSELTTRFVILSAIADIVTYTLVPGADAQAAAEAARKFAGTYSNGRSSLTLVVNQTAGGAAGPGLVISSWASNGTNVLASPLVDYTGLLPWRLVPSVMRPSGHRQSFRMITGNDEPSGQLPISPRLFSGRGFLAGDWISVDSVTYGGIGTSLFQFDVGSDGKATSVTVAAYRETLSKKQ